MPKEILVGIIIIVFGGILLHHYPLILNQLKERYKKAKLNNSTFKCQNCLLEFPLNQMGNSTLKICNKCNVKNLK